MIMMKFGKYMPLLMAAVMGIAFTSCHKDKKDDTTAKLYLNGSVKFNIPTYVRPGDIYELTPSGVSTKEHATCHVHDCQCALGITVEIQHIVLEIAES